MGWLVGRGSESQEMCGASGRAMSHRRHRSVYSTPHRYVSLGIHQPTTQNWIPAMAGLKFKQLSVFQARDTSAPQAYSARKSVRQSWGSNTTPTNPGRLQSLLNQKQHYLTQLELPAINYGTASALSGDQGVTMLGIRCAAILRAVTPRDKPTM